MKYGAHINPSLKRFVEWCSVGFVVYHDIWLEAHVAQGVDALKVLFWCGVEVG